MALTVSVAEIVERSNNPLLGKAESWGRVLLGDIATIQNGFAFKSSQFSKDAGIPLIRIRDVGKDTTDTRYIGEYDYAYVVNAGDLLVGMDGDFNCARWHGEPGLLNQRVCRVTLTSDIYHPKLLDYALPGYLKAINEMTSSVTVKHLSSKSIAEIPLPLPPMEQQEGIVAEIEKQFSRLDEAVANLKRVKANLKRYKAALLKAAVEGKLTEAWRIEAASRRLNQRQDAAATVEPASKLLDRILAERRARWEEAELAKMEAKGKAPKNDKWKAKYTQAAFPDTADLPVLPDEWMWTTLGSFLWRIEAGKSFKCEERPPRKGEVGVVKVSAVTWGEFDETESKTCLEDDLINEILFVQTGDFLFSRANTIELVGACVIAKGVLRNVMLSDKILRFGVVDGFDEWVLYCLRSPQGRAEIERLATGNQESMRNIGQERIRAIRIPLPPNRERDRIVTEVDRHLSLIRETETQVDANLQRAERLRQSILRRAFSGELGVQENPEAPADLLHVPGVSADLPYGEVAP